MKSIEEFYLQNLASAVSSSCISLSAALPEAVRQAANRGWHIFPVALLAKLNGNPDLLIGLATSDIDVLTDLAAQYPGCEWRVAAGPSSLCIVQLSGTEGSTSFASLSHESAECLTLQARRGDTAWGYFLWPRGLVLRKSARNLAPGMKILGRRDSCVIPPSGASYYLNSGAETEAVPSWLRELAFETPDPPAASAVPRFTCSANPHAHQLRTRFEESRTCAAKRHFFRSHTGRQTSFRISCRR